MFFVVALLLKLTKHTVKTAVCSILCSSMSFVRGPPDNKDFGCLISYNKGPTVSEKR